MTCSERLLTIAAGSILAFSALITEGRAAGFAIRAPATTGTLSIERQNQHAFRHGFGFALKTDVTRLNDEELRKHVASGFRSGSGQPVKAIALDYEGKVAIGTSVPNSTLRIAVKKRSDAGTHYVVSVRSNDGTFPALSSKQLGIRTFKGKHLGFELQPFTQATGLRAYVELLLDRSGSMATALAELKRSARTFVQGLGKNVRCRITVFNHGFTRLTRGFAPCAETAPKLRSIAAEGGTNLQAPLLAAYDDFANIRGSLKAVLIITDGRATLSRELLRKRKTAPTHALWLGWYRSRSLKGVVDTNLYGSHDVGKLLDRYFSTFRNVVASQFVITVKNK